jgi:hypothetical protein
MRALVLVVLLVFTTLSFAEEGGGDCSARGGGCIPNVLVWSVPRGGSSVFFQSLANSGHWGDNTYFEPLQMAALMDIQGVWSISLSTHSPLTF